MRAQFLVAFVFSTLAGCSTTVTIKKVNPEDTTTPGQRFSLPSRFVMVEPQPDGHVEVKFVHLPDDKNTFAISSESLMTKQTLSVTVASGLLTNVSNKGYATATANQLLTSVGNVRSKEIEAEKAAAKAAQTDIKTAQAQLELLDQQIRESELAVKQAEEKLRLAEAAFSGNEEKLLPFRADLAAARLKLDDLKAKRQTLGNANEPLTYNDPSAKPTQAWGPAFFAIVEDYSDAKKPVVKLVPVPFDGGSGPAQETFALGAGLPPRPTGATCPKFDAISKGPVLSGDRIINWSFDPVPDLRITKVTVGAFEKPDDVLLTIDGLTGNVFPTMGFPKTTAEEYTLQVYAVFKGQTCDIPGNARAP